MNPDVNMESKETNNKIEYSSVLEKDPTGILQKAEGINKTTKVKQANAANYRRTD